MSSKRRGTMMISTSLALCVVVAIPVAATTLAIAYHALRGSDPGPAADDLLRLVELVLLRKPPRRRSSRRSK